MWNPKVENSFFWPCDNRDIDWFVQCKNILCTHLFFGKNQIINGGLAFSLAKASAKKDNGRRKKIINTISMVLSGETFKYKVFLIYGTLAEWQRELCKNGTFPS